MSVAFSVRTPAQIASEINNLKRKTDKIMLENCVQLGRCLTEGKAVLSYGEWGKWLKEAVSYSQRTAENLMRIYREFGPKLASPGESLSDSKPVSNLSFTQAVALLGIPAEEREEFLACHDVENMSKRELQEAVREKKQAEPIPVLKRTGKPKTLRSVPAPATTAPAAAKANPESAKYDEQFALHRASLLSAFEEMQKTLVAQNRIDPAGKEVNQEKALELLTNLAAQMKEYPPKIKTNLQHA